MELVKQFDGKTWKWVRIKEEEPKKEEKEEVEELPQPPLWWGPFA